MQELIRKLKLDHPEIIFDLGLSHCWSPTDNSVSYTDDVTQPSLAGLLHEVGHARLKHARYMSDIELLQKEMEAWEEALRLAKEYDVIISEDHIQDCLDTYRDWLYKRSQCPVCAMAGLQQSQTRYICLNCRQTWQVTASRLHRPYRRSKAQILAQGI